MRKICLEPDLDPDRDFWPDPDLGSMNTDPKHWLNDDRLKIEQYIEFGSGFRILAQFGSGSGFQVRIWFWIQDYVINFELKKKKNL